MKKRIVCILVLTFIMSCLPVCAAPARVSNLRAKSKTESSVSLRWEKVKGAKTYQVYMSKQGKSKGFKKVAASSKSSAVIRNLSSGKNYWFKVRAVSGKKKGKFSSVIKVRTHESSVPNYTVRVGNSFKVFFPSGYRTILDEEKTLSFASNSLPASFIAFSAETARDLSDLKEYFSGSEKTYNGITGYEYSNGRSERSFSFEDGDYLYTVETSAQNPSELLHRVLGGLSW